MTDEEIIRMARKAGINFEPATESDDGIDTWYGHQYLPNGAIQQLISIAQAEEREACAKLATTEAMLQNEADVARNPRAAVMHSPDAARWLKMASMIRMRSNVKLRGAALLRRPTRTPGWALLPPKM